MVARIPRSVFPENQMVALTILINCVPFPFNCTLTHTWNDYNNNPINKFSDGNNSNSHDDGGGFVKDHIISVAESANVVKISLSFQHNSLLFTSQTPLPLPLLLMLFPQWQAMTLLLLFLIKGRSYRGETHSCWLFNDTVKCNTPACKKIWPSWLSQVLFLVLIIFIILIWLTTG